MRRYDDPVEVRRGEVHRGDAPEQFLWHGRLWKVRAVLAHWVETGAWWQSAGARAALGTDGPDSPDDADGADEHAGSGGAAELGADLLAERELWRVEAGTGPSAAGVFDLALSWSDGTWQLVGCAD